MKTLPTVVITVCVVMGLSGCSSQQMMEEPMARPMTGMEKPMDSMDATSAPMAKEQMMKQPETMNETMQ